MSTELCPECYRPAGGTCSCTWNQVRTRPATHRCPARRCPRTNVPASQLMCGLHWRLVPGPLQRAVWAAYKRGDGLGTAELMAAQAAAIRVVNEQLERTPPDA